MTTGDINLVAGYDQITTINTNFANAITIGNGASGGLIRSAGGGQLIVNGAGLGTTAGTVKIFVNNAINTNSTNGSLGLVAVGGKIATWITTTNGDYLAYTANGLVPTTYTVAGAAHNLDFYGARLQH